MAPKNPIAMPDPSYSPPTTHGRQPLHYHGQPANGPSTSTSSRQQRKEPAGVINPHFDARPANIVRSPYDARLLRKSSTGSSTTAKAANAASSPGAAPMAVARQQQRRRPTNYTSQYTPPASLVAHAAQARAKASTTQNSSRKKCSSLDRCEEDGDERRRHLKSGNHILPVPGGEHRGGEQYVSRRGSSHEQQLHQQQQLQQQQVKQQRHSYHEQQLLIQETRTLERRDRHNQRQLQQQGGGSSSRRSSGTTTRGSSFEYSSNNNSSATPSASGAVSSPSAAARKQHQQQQHVAAASASDHSQGSFQSASTSSIRAIASDSPRIQKQSISSVSPRHSQSKKSSSSSSSRQQSSSSHHHGSSSSRTRTSATDTTNEATTKPKSKPTKPELTEQQRIEEYAGKRALLRLEQELADHSESHASSHTGDDGASIKSVMDRKKLARVPQVKKSDLIIGEYLGRGNFCDVFEVTWILPGQVDMMQWGRGRGAMKPGGWSNSNRTLSTLGDDSVEDGGGGGGGGNNLEASMENLSCSNDLSLIRSEGMGASRRSVSQVTTTSSPRMSDPLRGSMSGGTSSSSTLRNPNVLALKCLRPAVRAQPRKFVIGAEDLAHETALLACLDHPNIIQLYGRAEGCFSTAFQMRSKNSNSGSDKNPKQEDGMTKGKQMSNEGYFIILDRLMTTLTDRIEEWKNECRAINGVIPPGGSPPVQLPPETTLREHLCKRLKVAYCIADALEYLHSRHCVFRDLKPANVGFDCNDCVKMFDFGFATSIAPLLSQPYEGYGPLTETCGTRRYMAPEVALKLGYGKEVDVYSFGMLLWEICALDKPFDSIQSVDEFHDLVVLCGRRPSLNIDPLWTVSLKNLMSRCWSTDPLDRPTMVQVKSLLCNVLRDMNKAMGEARRSGGGGSGGNGGGGRGGGSSQQRQEQGGNFIHKWRRRVSI